LFSSRARFLRGLGLVALVWLASATAQSSTLWEWKLGPFYTRSVLWDAAELTEPNLRTLYGQLSRELKDNRAWTVEVFTDKADAGHESAGKMVAETDYDRWLGLYNEFGRRLLPMAEILAYEKNAVLRLRNSAGACSEVVLSGENFLRVPMGAVEFEILKISYHPLPPSTEPSSGDEAMVSIYVRSPALPNEDQARQFSLLMQKRLQQKRIIVAFRNDAYFLTDGRFPVVYRFDPTARPPSREQYEQSETMYCFCELPGIQCGLRGSGTIR
jgi:hypothetical protein